MNQKIELNVSKRDSRPSGSTRLFVGYAITGSVPFMIDMFDQSAGINIPVGFIMAVRVAAVVVSFCFALAGSVSLLIEAKYSNSAKIKVGIINLVIVVVGIYSVLELITRLFR
jgi:uncharacterized membrane protein